MLQNHPVGLPMTAEAGGKMAEGMSTGLSREMGFGPAPALWEPSVPSLSHKAGGGGGVGEPPRGEEEA